jgi:hypothetical protein
MFIKSSILTVALLVIGLGSINAADKGKKGKGGEYKPDEIVKTFDKNADSKLSLEEFSAMKKFAKETDPKAAAKKAFEDLDSNKDGFVTADEMKAAHDKKMAAQKPPADKKPDAPKAEPGKDAAK